MTQHIRILETGEINTGECLFRFTAPEKIPFWRDFVRKSEIARLVHEHGAVCFEIDANYDEYYHEPDEDFGWGITYGEYWELYPDDKLEKPLPCWQTWVLFSASAPFMRSLSQTEDRALIAEWDTEEWTEDLDSGKYRFYLALTLATQFDIENDTLLDFQKPVIIKPRKISPLVMSDRTASFPVQGWQLGQDTTLQPLPYLGQTALSQCDWDWAWREHPSIGPIYLKIFVDKTSTELKDWFENIIKTRLPQNNFYPCLYINQYKIADELRIHFDDLAITELPTSDLYQCIEVLQTQRQGRLHQVYLPDSTHCYVAKSGDYPSGWLCLYDGQISLVRNYHTPDFDRQSIDAMLLTAILAGELGEISWDLFDGDYYYFEATGDGLDSLQTYLDPKSEPDRLRQEWSRLLVRHNVDASTANNAQEAAALIVQHFQVPLTKSEAIDNLETWLCTTPISQLPRYVTLTLPRGLGSTYREDPDYDRIISANSRILWRWSFAFDG